jgi:hypothetical protein
MILPYLIADYVVTSRYSVLKREIVPVLKYASHHENELEEGVEVYLRTLLTSSLDGGEWSASHSGLFVPRERRP